MSPTFEQQVREALGQLYEEWLKESRGKIAMLRWAAPRVAAAIEAAVREAASWDPEPRDYQDAMAAALDALRGGA